VNASAAEALTTGIGSWRELVEDDLLYCVVFSGEGQPHTNEPYCNTMPYRHRMFYGDGTLAIAYNTLLKCIGRTTVDTSIQSADARYTSRLFVGDRIRIKYEIRRVRPDEQLIDVYLEVENENHAVAMELDLTLRTDVRAFQAVASA
jgi:acyl dehydratase